MWHQRLLPITILLFPLFLFGQDEHVESSTEENDLILRRSKPPKLAIQAALLSIDLQENVPVRELQKKYLLRQREGILFVPALLKISPSFAIGKFNEFGVDVNAQVGSIYSVQIPLDHYEIFMGLPGLDYVELGKRVYPKLDKALEAAKVDLVHRGENLSQSYSGQGVIIGVIDFGFDYTHPTFCDPNTGFCRIKKVWEQNSLIGDPPTGFSYGRELRSESDIQSAEADLTLSGHGTHVASIAGGNGGSLANLYRGVAYESELVLVSLNAFEGVSGNSTGVIDGINYIFRYAESVGKPAVINISQGHHTGPHDGTSLADQAIDAMSGSGKIIVGANGNEGDESGFFLHFDHSFENEKSVLSYLLWPEGISAGSTIVDIWGEIGRDFQVGLEIFNPQSKTREGASAILQSSQPVSFISGHLVDLEGDTIHYEGGVEINAINNRPHAQFYVDNTAQSINEDVDLNNLLNNDFVQLRFQAQGGTVHAYAANNSGEAFFTDLSGIGADQFIGDVSISGGNPRSTMGELGGTAHRIISVGGYTTKNSITNIAGEVISVADVIGSQYFRTSQGPTLDGRIKPDISAPANLIAAAQNSFFTDADPSIATDQIDKRNGGHWNFNIRRGTSMAAPLVAGIVALMLEINPELIPEEIKELLTTYAEQDEHTGSVPNNIWGYGKVNAASLMLALELPTSTHRDVRTEFIQIFPNPNKGRFTVTFDKEGPAEIMMVDHTGRNIHKRKFTSPSKQIEIDLHGLSSGIYWLLCKQNGSFQQQKLVIFD